MNNTAYYSLDHFFENDYPSGAALLIRHAARHAILPGEDPDLAMLTGEGIQQAFQFGRDISRRYTINRVFSSPVQRCVDTGTNILSGAGIQQPVLLKWWLYTPFVNLGRAYKGHPDITEIVIEGFENYIHTRYMKLMGERIQVPGKKNHLNIYLTHDTSIQAFTTYLMDGDRKFLEEFPGFLQGTLLCRQNGSVHACIPEQSNGDLAF